MFLAVRLSVLVIDPIPLVFLRYATAIFALYVAAKLMRIDLCTRRADFVSSVFNLVAVQRCRLGRDKKSGSIFERDLSRRNFDDIRLLCVE